jgi:hypothetical protein
MPSIDVAQNTSGNFFAQEFFRANVFRRFSGDAMRDVIPEQREDQRDRRIESGLQNFHPVSLLRS